MRLATQRKQRDPLPVEAFDRYEILTLRQMASEAGCTKESLWKAVNFMRRYGAFQMLPNTRLLMTRENFDEFLKDWRHILC